MSRSLNPVKWRSLKTRHLRWIIQRQWELWDTLCRLCSAVFREGTTCLGEREETAPPSLPPLLSRFSDRSGSTDIRCATELSFSHHPVGTLSEKKEAHLDNTTLRQERSNVTSSNTWVDKVKYLSMRPWARHLTPNCSRVAVDNGLDPTLQGSQGEWDVQKSHSQFTRVKLDKCKHP